MYITSDLAGAGFPLLVILILGVLATVIFTKVGDQGMQQKAIGALLGIDLREKPQDLRVTSCSKEAEGRQFTDYWIVAKIEEADLREIVADLNLHRMREVDLESVPFGMEGPDCGKCDAGWWKPPKVSEREMLTGDADDGSRDFLVSYDGKRMYVRMRDRESR